MKENISENKEKLKINILCVDDDSTTTFWYKRILPRIIAGTIKVFEKGEELIKELNNSGVKYDIIITDRQMPKMDGLKVIEKVRETHPNMPIIVYTSGANDDEIEKIKKLGTVYLAKPVDKDILLKIIKEVIKNREAKPE